MKLAARKFLILSLTSMRLMKFAVMLRSWSRSLFKERSLRLEDFTFFHDLEEVDMQRDSYASNRHSSQEPLLTAIVNLHRPDKYFETVIGDLKVQTAVSATEIILVVSNLTTAIRRVLETELASAARLVILDGAETSVYQAWNLALTEATMPFVTNVNDDDRRLPYSFEEQIFHIHERPHVDIHYGDFLLAQTPRERAEPHLIRHKVGVGDFTTDTLLFEMKNYVHAFPAWRRELHHELGPFRTDLTSAGDVDFWLRCLLSKKVFSRFPSEAPQNVYYWNPEGVSSSSGSKGAEEWGAILDNYGPNLIKRLANL